MREEKYDAADRLLDRVADQIRSTEPDAAVTEAAAQRVWQKLSRRGIALVGDDGSLPEQAKATVHSLDAARERRRPRYLPWAIAAVLLVGLGVAQLVLRGFPAGPAAVVQTVDGQLFHVGEEAHLPIQAGTEVDGRQTVRTGREGGAVLRLADGSLVEMRARSEVFVDESRSGTTIHLERGSVIVEAADQRDKHLYVATDDCLVSVTGTIFSVDHGTKGSRVAVIEGEVHVDHSGQESVLTPGDQVATRPSLDLQPLAKSLAWSRGVDEYLELLEEYDALQRDIAAMPHPGLRYASQLLELMPPETVVYAAAPNLGETLGAAHDLLLERLDESPALRQWADENGAFHDEIERAFNAFAELGGYLGSELAVGVLAHDDEAKGFVALADTMDAAGLRDFVVRQLQQHEADAEVVFVDDPLAILPLDGDALYLWSTDDLTVASNDPAELRGVAERLAGAANPFVATAFYDSISALYGEGAEVLVAVDAHTLVGLDAHGDSEQELAMLGVDDVRHVLFEQKRTATTTVHSASVTFDEARSGLAAWLAEPAPMGALDFVSPDAQLVVSAVFQDPVKMLDDILQASGGLPGPLQDFEREYGVSLRDDVAATLGGELTLALDGPLLPSPSWKAIIEVYDPARLQYAFEQALAEVNEHLVAEGEEPLEIVAEEIGGRTVYTLDARLTEVHYTFVEGYLLMAPNNALIDQAIRYRDSGYSLTQSPRFLAQMPADGRNNFSALAYQDLAGVMQTITERIANGDLTDEQRQQLEALSEQSEPTLAYVYGEDDRIVFSAATEGDFLSNALLRVFGLKDPAGFETVLQGLFS
ncbi:MAG: FecR domain-containing protein [Acidobacteriota bacterium]